MNTDATAQSVSPLCGGVHSNWRVQAQLESQSYDFVIRRMPPAGQLGFARQQVVPYSLEKEFTVLTELAKTALLAPKVWGFDAVGKFLGTPAFLMEYLEGPTVLEAVESQPETAVQAFAETILAMNRISSAQVPSLSKPASAPIDVTSWLDSQSQSQELPSWFYEGMELLKASPGKRPQAAFGNGDLNPQNFIYTNEGKVAVVDWEYAGFNDPLAELMLLHGWPEDRPFLDAHPLDKIYCDLAGIDVALLPWYEMYGALSGWIYASRDQHHKRMALHEQWAKRLLDKRLFDNFS